MKTVDHVDLLKQDTVAGRVFGIILVNRFKRIRLPTIGLAGFLIVKYGWIAILNVV